MDQKRLFLAIALSAVILLAFQLLLPPPFHDSCSQYSPIPTP